MKSKHQLHEVSIKAIVTDRRGRILILKETGGKWVLPGGRVHIGETVLQALKRELKEEVSINRFRIREFLYGEIGNDRKPPVVMLTYRIITPVGTTYKPSSEIESLRWITKQEIHKVDFWHASYKRALKKAFEERR